MNYIILIALVIIAVCMALGKPLQVTIHHKYDVPASQEIPVPVEQEKFDKEQKSVFDEVISQINEAMGVNVDADNDSRT